MIKNIQLRLKPIYFLVLIFCFPFTDVDACNAPDKAGTITGKNTTCYGVKETFTVPSIALATSYKWTLPAMTQVVSGANNDTITVIFWGSGGDIRVQGVNTCDTGISSAFTVKVNSLPTVNIISSQKYCCNSGNISLGSSSFASPTGGTWKCRQNPSLINGNTFLTSSACNPAKTGFFTLYYIYQDPTTTCVNTDSTYFSINPLPPLSLKGGSYCQNIIETSLKSNIMAPINLNSMTDVKWKLLKTLPKPGGGNYTINDLVYDADATLNYDFKLKVDSGTINLGTKTKDSIVLEITIQDGAGCFNRDTATFVIVKMPVITFNAFPGLCIDAGKVNLTKISNTMPGNGCWGVISKTGYKDSIYLKPGIKSCDTLNTMLLSLQNGPGLYWMRYVYNSGSCSAMKEMELRIYPLPNVTISASPTGDRGKYCETDGEVTLNSSPAGGTWTSSAAGAISGSVFKPASVSSADRDKWIIFTYTYVHPTTKCDTAKSLSVFVQSAPILNIVTQDIDTCRKDSMNFKLTAKSFFTSKINWVHSSDPSKASFENKKQLSNSNPAIFTIKPRKDSVTFINITVFTEAEGVCPFTEDNMQIRIDTVNCKDSMVGIRPIAVNKPFEVILFPNPAKGKFNIEVKKPGNYFLKLYSMEGQLLLEQKLEGFEINTIDQKLFKGIYTLFIDDTHGNSIAKKIVVE